MRTICELYAHAPQLATEGTHLISCDEKPGIQALERQAPTRPMRPGSPERQEFDYTRHGTQTLIVSFQVATGTIDTASVGPRRTEEDFAQHIAQTVATEPAAGWLFIVDQLNIHQSETLVHFVAQACGITPDLGVKGKQGILQSRATRADFLQDSSHRIRFVYTPKHTSWLNQVELWFSILVRRLLKRLSVCSVEQLRERLLAFIAYFNRTMAKPFKWTYKGRPLMA